MNTQTKSALIGVALVLVLGIGYVYVKKAPAGVSNSPLGQLVDSPTSTKPEPSSSQVVSGGSQNTVRDMWTVWSGFLNAAKNHDVSNLAEYTYTLSDTCKDPKQKKACFDKMDAVYAIGSKLQKSDFLTQYEDAKQGILETKLTPISSDRDFGYRKSVLIFVKGSDGNPKLIALKPNEEWKVKRNPASTTAELERSLEEMVKDTDQDGLTDQIEKCIFPDNLLVVSCIESNPNKRDTDRDGYWDGVGFLIPKK